MGTDTNTVIERTRHVHTSMGIKVIRELSLDDIQYILADLVALYAVLPDSVLKGSDGIQVATTLLMDKGTMTCVKHILARVTDTPPEDYADLSFRDALKLINEFIRVNPLKEMYELFLSLKVTVLHADTEDKVQNESASASNEGK